MKISTRLLFLFVLVSVLPLALFSYFNLQADEATERVETMERLSGLADKKVGEIKTYLWEREREVRNRALGPRTGSRLISLRKAYGASLKSAAYVKESAELHKGFLRAVEESGLFYDVFLITPQGEIIYTQKHESDFATNLLTGAYRESQLAWAFRQARISLEPVISGYEYYSPSSAPALFIAAPVIVDGKFEGVFAAQLGNDLFHKVATDATGLGVSGETTFGMREGNGVLYTLPLKYRQDAAMKFHVDRSESTLVQIFAAASGESGEGMRTDYRGKSVVAAWRYLPELDWGMVVKMDSDEVFASVSRQRTLMLEALLGLLIFAGLIAYHFGRQISVPLQKLAQRADEMAKGNLDKHADESAPGELGLFARSFNRMAGNLQELYRSLEDRIEERTEQLYASNEELQQEVVEREMIEQSLQQTTERITSLMNSVVEGIYGVDKQGNFVFINAAGLHMLGYQEESELLGLHAHELIHHTHPDGTHYPTAECRLYQCLRSHENVHADDEVFWRKDGSAFPVDYWSRPAELDGEWGAVVTFIDITERHLAEQRIAYSENVFRGLFESINSGVAVYEAVDDGEDFVFRDYNRAAELLDKTKRESVIGKRVTECFPGVKEFGLFAVFQRVWKSGVAEHFPVNVYRDSHLLAWRDNQVFRLPSGEVVAVYEDVTARKEAEEQLRISAAAFETHEGIMITDAKANIIRVNRAFEKITGYSSEEVLGKNPRILSSGKQSKEFYAKMWKQIIEEGFWSGEIWDRRKSGETYPKWLTISVVKDEKGRTTEYVAIFNDITARKQAEEEIRNLAFFDALTGLPNRRSLLDRIHAALILSARRQYCGALLFLDMDKFKTLNDTQGHDYGDLMLIEVARRIQVCVRETDTVARLGGDEFVVLFEEVSTKMPEASQKVALIAEKIRAALSEVYVLKKHEFHSSPSIGVCMYKGTDVSVDTLMKQADMAMYQAKDAGRNAIRFFDPLMQQAVEAHAELEADLRGALQNRELLLHYQIQVDSENRPLGAEALIRWKHPKRGMVPPIQFIPVAEESSLILDIGHWVFVEACRQLAEWKQDEQMNRLILAVNVSSNQFRLRDFVPRLHEVIARYDINPERLKLELTESVVLGDVADVVGKMHALKALGVRLSLDDFGTGYSSLAYLKQLPLDQIKIDQSFVRDVITDPSDAVMVKTIIDMAQNFRLNAIAEGVETEAQLAFLKQNGCMAYQGYLFSKPVPVAEFEALARRLFGQA